MSPALGHGFAIAEVRERDFKLDTFKWLKAESIQNADLPESEEFETDVISELEEAVEELNAVLTHLESAYNGTKSGRATP